MRLGQCILLYPRVLQSLHRGGARTRRCSVANADSVGIVE
jgi:hypothetical protein